MQSMKSILDQLWKETSPDRPSRFPGWHGYSTQNPDGKIVIYIEPGRDSEKNSEAVKDALAQRGIPKNNVRALFIPRFRQIPGKRRELKHLHTDLSAGFPVQAKGCGTSDTGTICAFLNLAASPLDSRPWLLTCLHVIAEDPPCLRHLDNISIFSPDSMSPIATGNDLIFDNSPFFDACIFQVNAGTNQYDSTLGITSTSPIVSLALNAPVTKQGDGTDITHGIFLQLGDVLAVPNSDGKFTFDYCNVLIIESQDSSHPFLGPGDSGSLVVSSGQPAGLLCAMTDDLDGLTVVPPLGLAIPFKTVLDKLSPLVSSGSSLVMAPLK